MLIYISDDRIEVGKRMKFLEDSGTFGRAQYVPSLDQWEQEEDISLYIFRQPMYEWSSFMAFLRDNGANLWKRVQQSPKIYFVLFFPINDWQSHQIRFLKFDLLKTAKSKMI